MKDRIVGLQIGVGSIKTAECSYYGMSGPYLPVRTPVSRLAVELPSSYTVNVGLGQDIILGLGYGVPKHPDDTNQWLRYAEIVWSYGGTNWRFCRSNELIDDDTAWKWFVVDLFGSHAVTIGTFQVVRLGDTCFSINGYQDYSVITVVDKSSTGSFLEWCDWENYTETFTYEGFQYELMSMSQFTARCGQEAYDAMMTSRVAIIDAQYARQQVEEIKAQIGGNIMERYVGR